MSTWLDNVLQTEEQPDRFFVGELEEFFNQDGSVRRESIMKRLDELDFVVKRRITRLQTR